MVAERHDFAFGGEQDVVVARHGPAAQGRKADAAAFARALNPIAARYLRRRQVHAAPLRRRLTQQQRRARWRVHFMPVVHFDDFYVPIGAQPRRRFTHQKRQHIDAQRGIARLQHRNILRRIVDKEMVPLLQPRRADEDGDARAKGSVKRGGAERERVPLDSALALAKENEVDLLDLEEQLVLLTTLNERQARIVECRCFSGMTIAEVAEVLDVAAEHPEIVERLLALAEQARTDLGDHDRIGAGQRFFDPEPKRPDLEKDR